MKRTLISILTLGALLTAVLIGAAVYHSASAAAPTTAAFTYNGNAFNGFGRGFGSSYTNEDLANALGITVDQLTAAYQKAYDAALTQAVEKGLITQAQADQLKSNGFAFPFGGRWGGWLSQNGIDFDDLLADALGITVDKLQSAYVQAYNAQIDRAVANGNLTQEQGDLMKGRYALFANKNFKFAMQSAFEAAVKQAVTDGVITQAQADLILKNASGMGFGFQGGFGGPGGFGGFRGGRGRHGWFGGGAPSIPQSPTAKPSSGT